MTYPKTVKLLIINVFFLSLYIIGLDYGIIAPLYTSDASKISFLISLLMGIIMVSSSVESFNQERKNKNFFVKKDEYTKIDEFMDFMSDKFLYVGLSGTLCNLIIIARLLITNSSQTGDQQLTAAINTISGGLASVFSCLLLGIVSKIFVDILIKQKVTASYEG